LIGKTEHNVKNLYEFVDFFSTLVIHENEKMVLFDVASLFTKIPVELALKIAKERLESIENLDEITTWSMEDICNGLKICLEATYLKFREYFYKQIFGTALGSLVSVVVANLVMEDVKKRALTSFRKAPRVWKRYVNDTFIVLDKTTLDDFFIHLNKIENSINFTMEKEKDNCISFLDIKITRTDKGTISTTVYRKPTAVTGI